MQQHVNDKISASTMQDQAVTEHVTSCMSDSVNVNMLHSTDDEEFQLLTQSHIKQNWCLFGGTGMGTNCNSCLR